MRLAILLLASAGLTLAVKAPKPRKIQHGVSKNQSPNHNSLLTLRQSSCDTDQFTCEVDYCMPMDATCCYNGDGSYCENGDLCVDGGCCAIGDDCDGSLTTECGDDEEQCGWGCMPVGSVCCDDDSSLGTYCDAGETCDGFLCEDGSGADDEDDGPHLCARRRGGGGGGGGGGSFGDDCDAAGTVSASLASAVMAAIGVMLL